MVLPSISASAAFSEVAQPVWTYPAGTSTSGISALTPRSVLISVVIAVLPTTVTVAL